MLKKKFVKLLVLLSFCIVFYGCKQNSMIDYENVDNGFKYELSKKINDMKEIGLFNGMLTNNRLASDEDSQLLNRFINETDSVLEELKDEENGIEQIQVIEALFCGATVEEFSELFSKLDNTKADEYLELINSQFEIHDDESISRNILGDNSIYLSYANIKSEKSREAYGDNLEWSTIGWYSGFCASTVAGCYLITYGGLWTRIAGIAAATAGGVSMGIQLTKWAKCTDLISFVKSLTGLNVTTANNILNSDNGKKIALITTETVATVTACYFTAPGKLIANKFISLYNAIIEKILSVLPKGIVYTICGIKLKTISI